MDLSLSHFITQPRVDIAKSSFLGFVTQSFAVRVILEVQVEVWRYIKGGPLSNPQQESSFGFYNAQQYLRIGDNMNVNVSYDTWLWRLYCVLLFCWIAYLWKDA